MVDPYGSIAYNDNATTLGRKGGKDFNKIQIRVLPHNMQKEEEERMSVSVFWLVVFGVSILNGDFTK